MRFHDEPRRRNHSIVKISSFLLATLLVVEFGTGAGVSSVALAQTPAIASLTLSPSTIAGGSGSSATGTVTLSAPAPAGGAVVTLASSNIELAATMPSVTVPQGATTATFSVGTNAGYRAYSNLSFTATISATLGTARNATLTVTAQPRPPDFTSGSTAGANTQWEGLMCGGIAPIGGYNDILYSCSGADATGFGTCTFRQECTIGCRRVPPTGGSPFRFNDFCATTGANPIEISDNYFTSGDHVPAIVRTEAPVTRPTTGVPNVRSIGEGVNARGFSPEDVGGLHFPVGVGATTMPFDVATSYVPQIEFIDVGGFWYDDDIPPFLIISGRSGHRWAVMLPPSPPPAQPIPTPVQFKIVGLNPVTGGDASLGQVHTSGLPYGIGPSISFTSSHPSIVPAPASVIQPQENLLGFDVPIETIAPDTDTDVTITATDGRYSFSAVLTVRKPPPPPVLAGVSVNPGSVVGGTQAIGTVHLSAPQSQSTVVQVSILENAPASLPSNTPPCPPSSRCHNVTVAAGQTQADFTINTQTVTSQFNLNVFAHVPAIQGNTGKSALLLITPGGGPLSLKFLTVTPDALTGGSNATGTVTLSGAAPSGGAVVTLTKSFADGSPGTVPITVPASVTVPAGQSTASFTIGTSSVTTTVTVTVHGAFNGSTALHHFVLFPLLSALQFEGTVPGGQPATGTVFLSSGAPSGGLVVSLSSLNTSRVTVPASVTVPAGQTSVNFTANTFPVTQFTGVEVRATGAGRTVSATLFLSVSLAPTSVTFTPSTIVGPGTVTGRVTLGSASPGNSNVSLVSSNSVLATVPFSVIVPQGQTSATFPVNVAQVTTTTTVQISATFDNVTRSGTLTINPPGGGGPTLSAVSLNPTSVVGGSSSTGTVTLSGAAPTGGLAVSLSDNSTAASTPSSVTVPAGATSATFTVSTVSVATTTIATLTATASSTSRTADLTITAAGGGGGGGGGAAGFLSPTANAPDSGGDGNGFQSSPVNAYADDVAIATDTNSGSGTSTSCTNSGKDRHRFYDFGFAIPGGSAIAGIEVRLDARADSTSGSPRMCVQLSWDGGTTWTAAKATGTLSTSMNTVMLGGATDTWGRTWSAANLTNANFRLRVINVAGSTSRDFFLDWVAVRPHLATAGPAALSAVSVSPTSVTGSTSAQGTVTLTAAAPAGGAVVSLSSSNTGAASVPASVTIAAGATSATFAVTTAAVTANTPVTVTATYNGTSTTATLTVTAVPPPVTLQSVSVNPTSVTGGTTSQGTVTLSSGAPAGGAVVSLTSSNTAAVTVPASVTVAAGATSTTFSASTVAVSAATPVTISAVYSGVTRTAALTVNPPAPTATLSSISVSPSSVTGGTGSTGTVTLSSGAPSGGAVVSLTSSNTAAANVPASVTIAAGATTATFAATTSSVASSTAVTITATYAGVTRTTTLTVNPQGQSATLTVTATGRSGERVTSTPTGISVNVGTTGSAPFTIGTSITLRVSDSRDAIWSGACSSGGTKTETCTFTLSGNATVNANVQ
jgi:hypothetical protein